MPCSDASNAINEGKIKTELTKATNHKGDHQPDNCSPFCNCGCCVGSSITHFIASIIIISQYSDSPSRSFMASEIVKIALPIWQPPRLV